MKRFFAVTMAVLMTAALCGCGVVQNPPASTGGPAAGEANTAVTAASPDTTAEPAVPLEGAAVVLKMSHGDGDTSMLSNTWNCYARVFKQSLEVYSGGEVTLDVHPNDSLGGTTSCLEQCSQGSIDIALSAASGALAGWVPNVSLFDVPYLIEDIDACNIVCEGVVRQTVSEELQEAGNMRLLTLVQTAFRYLDTWNRAVRTVDDVKGMKFRVQEMPAHIAMAESWGTIPSSVAFTELYSAASTGVIDCYDQCNYGLFMNNLYENVKYITETQHAANICICVMNEQSWAKLTPQQQAAVERAADDARRATLGVVQANNFNYTNRLEAAGIEIIALSDEQRATFAGPAYKAGLAAIQDKVDPEFVTLFESEYQAALRALGRRE